ncbi:MAG: hypothetical protein ACOCP8_05900 [archaeon]
MKKILIIISIFITLSFTCFSEIEIINPYPLFEEEDQENAGSLFDYDFPNKNYGISTQKVKYMQRELMVSIPGEYGIKKIGWLTFYVGGNINDPYSIYSSKEKQIYIPLNEYLILTFNLEKFQEIVDDQPSIPIAEILQNENGKIIIK